MIFSVVTVDCLLGTEIDDKLAGTLALEKNVVVTGLNNDFLSSIGLLVIISAGALVVTTVTAAVGDGLLDVKVDVKLAGT